MREVESFFRVEERINGCREARVETEYGIDERGKSRGVEVRRGYGSEVSGMLVKMSWWR